MSSIRTLQISDAIGSYLERNYAREDDIWRELRAETAQLTASGMQIGADQARLLGWLVRLIGAQHALEIGTFTGASALAVARALPDDGKLVACDVSAEWTDIARRHWIKAGVRHKIELRLAPALETLAQLASERQPPFDFAFIDADKEPIQDYFEQTLPLLRVGGVIAVDNTLWGGAVADPSINDPDTVAIRNFNASVARDPRVDATLLTVGDGVTLIHKL